MPHSLGTASRQGGLAHRGCLLLLLLGLLRHLGWLRAGGLTLFHHVLVLQVVGSDHWGHDEILLPHRHLSSPCLHRVLFPADF